MLAVLSSIRTAFGAIGIETFGRTSLHADTRLYARLSLRDTQGVTFVHHTCTVSIKNAQNIDKLKCVNMTVAQSGW